MEAPKCKLCGEKHWGPICVPKAATFVDVNLAKPPKAAKKTEAKAEKKPAKKAAKSSAKKVAKNPEATRKKFVKKILKTTVTKPLIPELKSARKPGRPPIGDKAMSGAERVAAYRARKKASA